MTNPTPHDPAASTDQAAALGVTLEPGERVIRVDVASYTAERVVLAILGVMFLVIVVGVVLIVLAVFWERWQPRGVVVTDRRVVAVDKNGVATATNIAEVTDVESERQQSATGGGIAGALVGLAVDAVADHVADKNPKADPGYWRRTAAIVLVLRGGARVRVPTRRAMELGPAIVRALGDRPVAP